MLFLLLVLSSAGAPGERSRCAVVLLHCVGLFCCVGFFCCVGLFCCVFPHHVHVIVHHPHASCTAASGTPPSPPPPPSLRLILPHSLLPPLRHPTTPRPPLPGQTCTTSHHCTAPPWWTSWCPLGSVMSGREPGPESQVRYSQCCTPRPVLHPVLHPAARVAI